MSWDIESFKQKLESEHSFPGMYIFKFIVPGEQKDAVIQVLPKGELSFKHSSGNKYISLTLRANVKSSEEVVRVYQDAYAIKGIVAL
jgi:putative lipoic acid-binding regulatory protein